MSKTVMIGLLLAALATPALAAGRTLIYTISFNGEAFPTRIMTMDSEAACTMALESLRKFYATTPLSFSGDCR